MDGKPVNLDRALTLPEPIYLDNHLLVVSKPAGLLVQKDNTGDPSLYDLAAAYLKSSFQKPGNVFLGIVHRLDRPVSGVMVLARTSKAASRLSDEFRRKQVEKRYWALVEGTPPSEGRLVDWIQRKDVTSFVSDPSSGQKAELSFRVIRQFDTTALLEIKLDTGRHHQIRVQLAHIGFPIIGDFRYGSRISFPRKAIALHARSIKIKHPVRNETVCFSAPLDHLWPGEVRVIESG